MTGMELHQGRGRGGGAGLLLLLVLLGWVGWLTWDRFNPFGVGSVAPRQVEPRGDLASFEKTTIAIFEKGRPSVVSVTSSRLMRRDRFSLRTLEVPQGMGSGFVWDQEGHIVTNNHVVRQAGDVVFEVTMFDGKTYRAALVGTAPEHDLAVLKITASPANLRPIEIGSSADLKVGQSAFAIGNPFGLQQSLTSGIVSALGREIASIPGTPIREVIQTDAAINPGNSGGPLLDSAGRLIGVNTAIAGPAGQNAGIGFAIPVDTVNFIIPRLVAGEKVLKPLLGVRLAPDDMELNRRFGGVVITGVEPDTPAAEAGFQGMGDSPAGEPIDVIVAVDGRPVRTARQLQDAIRRHEVGEEIEIEFERRGERLKKTVKLTLGR
jgi:S1-C subfamily serine protease